MTTFLINPPRKRSGASKRRRRRTAAQRAATAKMVAANKRRRRAAHNPGGSMAAKRKRRRRRVTASAAPRRRRRRSVRRNPGVITNPRRRRRRATVRARRRVRRNPPAVSFNNITSTVVRGVQDAGLIVGGKMAANVLGNLIPPFLKDSTGAETQVGATVRRLLSAAAVGVVAKSLLRTRDDTARMLVAGALTAPVEAFVRPMLAGIPLLSGSLSGLRMLPRMAAYPAARHLSAYPRLRGVPRASQPAQAQFFATSGIMP